MIIGWLVSDRRCTVSAAPSIICHLWSEQEYSGPSRFVPSCKWIFVWIFLTFLYRTCIWIAVGFIVASTAFILWGKGTWTGPWFGHSYNENTSGAKWHFLVKKFKFKNIIFFNKYVNRNLNNFKIKININF